ncbi:hypothetical protein LTR28_004210 [Elasticomyces elasticus]|nr:hypothetical protein LTR28_004210 [Elasticomyces elasticus]
MGFAASYLPRTQAKASLQHAARATNVQANLGTTFISTDQGGWVSFSLNVVGSGTNAGDLYFHMEGSATKEWIAIGIGEEMQNALMFVVYADHTGHGTRSSPPRTKVTRTTKGEPFKERQWLEENI